MMNILSTAMVLLFIVNIRGETEEEIKKRVMETYNKEAFPPGIPTTLLFGVSIIDYELNEARQTLEMDLWLRMNWEDKRITYDGNRSDFSFITLDSSKVWIPDLSLYNSAQPRTDGIHHTKVLAHPDGKMLWVPPAHMKAYCHMDMTHWPHDTHKCIFKFGSWVNDGFRLKLEERHNVESGEKHNSSIHLSDLYVSKEEQKRAKGKKEWDMLSAELNVGVKYYSCCPEPYGWINVEVILTRHSPAYDNLVQGPVIVMCLLTVIVFLLPPASGEKILLGSVALLLDFVFLFKVSAMIGVHQDYVPLIINLISKQLQITTACVVLSALISRMARVPKGRQLPHRLQNALIKIAPALFLGGYVDLIKSSKPSILQNSKAEEEEMTLDGAINFDTNNSKTNAPWFLFAAVIDRLCLLLFLFIFVIILGVHSKVL